MARLTHHASTTPENLASRPPQSRGRPQHLPYPNRPLRSPFAMVIGSVSRARLASRRCAGWCRASLVNSGCERRQPKAVRQRSLFNSSASADGPVLKSNARSGPHSPLVLLGYAISVRTVRIQAHGAIVHGIVTGRDGRKRRCGLARERTRV